MGMVGKVLTMWFDWKLIFADWIHFVTIAVPVGAKEEKGNFRSEGVDDDVKK